MIRYALSRVTMALTFPMIIMPHALFRHSRDAMPGDRLRAIRFSARWDASGDAAIEDDDLSPPHFTLPLLLLLLSATISSESLYHYAHRLRRPCHAY